MRSQQALTQLGNLDVFGPTCSPDDLLCDIMPRYCRSVLDVPILLPAGRTGCETGVDAVCRSLVASEPHQRELCLDHTCHISFEASAGMSNAEHTWLDLAHADVGVDELAQQTTVERPHGGLGSAVNTTTGVRFTSGDRAKVDDHLSAISWGPSFL
jgi:hypothetical protein